MSRNIYDEEWVCESHPDKPFEHDGCNGAGMLAEEVSPIYKSIGEHPGFTAQGAFDAFVKQYTQNQLDAAIAAERERCAQICEALEAEYGWVGPNEPGANYGMELCSRAIRNQEKN